MTTNTVFTTLASERPILGFLADSQCEVISGGVVGTLPRRVAAQSSSPAPSVQSSSPALSDQSSGTPPVMQSSFSAMPDFGQLVLVFGSQFPSLFNNFSV